MKRWFAFLPIILIFWLVSCAPSVEEIADQTATAATAIAASWTKTSIPTATYTPTFTPTLTQTPTITPTITLTPLGGGSGQIALLSSSGSGVSLVNSDGTGTFFLADSPYLYATSYYAWSPNGRRFAYPGDGGICAIDTYDLSVKCFGISGTVAWSPDDSKLALGSIGDGGITIVDVASGERRALVEDHGTSPDWSPDGTKIIFYKQGDVYVINADGSDETLLVKHADYPIWSPDGTQIAYTYTTGNYDQQNIFIMNADGTNKVKLTPAQPVTGNGNIIWSSDGKYIVYLAAIGSVYGNRNDIYTLEIESHTLTNLTKSHNVLGWTLSPDSKMIAYTVESFDGSGVCFQSFLTSIDGVSIAEWKSHPCFSIVGPWRPKSNLEDGAGFQRSTKGQAWEFESNASSEGWEGWNQLTPLQVRNGSLFTESTGGDPYMHSPQFSLNATLLSKIEIRMKVSSGNSGQLFFITNTDTIYDERKSLRFIVFDDGEFHTYILKMSNIRGWNKVIQQIRLDPTDRPATIEIDYLRILTP